MDDVEYDVTLTLDRRGEVLTGEYTVGAVPGSFRGATAGGSVTADLSPSQDCTYTFEGTLSDVALIGAFEPTECPGGRGGTWKLERK